MFIFRMNLVILVFGNWIITSVWNIPFGVAQGVLWKFITCSFEILYCLILTPQFSVPNSTNPSYDPPPRYQGHGHHPEDPVHQLSEADSSSRGPFPAALVGDLDVDDDSLQKLAPVVATSGQQPVLKLAEKCCKMGVDKNVLFIPRSHGLTLFSL